MNSGIGNVYIGIYKDGDEEVEVLFFYCLNFIDIPVTGIFIIMLGSSISLK